MAYIIDAEFAQASGTPEREAAFDVAIGLKPGPALGLTGDMTREAWSRN